jgi:transcription elongation factor Elf1
MLLKCDGKGGCGKEFRIETFEVEKLEKDIEKIYFTCPHCNKEYISFYTDRHIRKKQELIREITSESALKTLKEEISKDMRKLRRKVEASTK